MNIHCCFCIYIFISLSHQRIRNVFKIQERIEVVVCSNKIQDFNNLNERESLMDLQVSQKVFTSATLDRLRDVPKCSFVTSIKVTKMKK